MPSRHHFLYSRPLDIGPGRVHIKLFDGGTKFVDLSQLNRGILVRNEQFTQEGDPNPLFRHIYNLRPGQYIENPALSGTELIKPDPIDPMPFTWQTQHGIKMPNFELSLRQYLYDSLLGQFAVGWNRTSYSWSECSKWAPIGTYLRKTGTGAEYWADHFDRAISPRPETMVLVATPGGGRWGIKYQEGPEALGGRNTSNKDPVTGRTIWQLEAESFELVEDVFFHAFDTTDWENFRITIANNFDAPGESFGFTVSRGSRNAYNVYLIPRQWFYFVYILAWYLIVTYWFMIYHPLPYVTSWYDRPPVHPHPYTGSNYWGEIFGGWDDYGVYWKVIHDERFLQLLSSLRDFEMTSYLMGIIWVGVEYFYYRVRSFPALERQLCAVIEQEESGKRWYVWRRKDEVRDTFTMVDSFFWPENYP